MSRPIPEPAVTPSDPVALDAPEHPFAGMTVMDTSVNPRIPILIEMVEPTCGNWIGTRVNILLESH